MMKMPFDGRKEKEGDGLISCNAITQTTHLEFIIEFGHFLEADNFYGFFELFILWLSGLLVDDNRLK
jgi:hypothetical protein